MPARRRRRLGSDRLYVTSSDGLPLGHLDLVTRVAHDVPAGYRERFVQEANAWLWQNHLPPMGSPSEVAAEPSALGAGVEAPEGGWDPGWEDLALRLPGHGLLEEAATARAARGPEADRPYRLRADGQHAVAEALGKLTRSPALRRGRGARWRILHAVPMASDEGHVVIDHVVIGPPGLFTLQVVHLPGGRITLGDEELDLGGSTLDLPRWRRIGVEAADRVSEGLARAAGATETLDPPAVHPVVVAVGAILVGQGRPRGVTVTRVGPLPRLLTAFGSPLSDLAVAQTYEVARRSTTWSP
ncbi:nuclease-related domain-containing protein [Actinomycetospora cinnamomea]|uniref:Nuclease-like protein n=1 Tax=Actinomycetospora cinnamomea TaxID=663609 RepID=A0A2U1E8W8_9PSEU|nr:nuclease-related domain-containing protein [Actinomycetospora cinnamomea]PVY96325.1 nuclease-like protein [Actinomycetospora cinnamomea]